MFLNKICNLIIKASINRYFNDTDVIRFMGEYVYARKTLTLVWLNDLSEFEDSISKIIFSISRAKESRYFKNKIDPLSDTCHPSTHLRTGLIR